MNFVVKQEQFEGPLDLLLDLIERRQMHVSDVALARVTEDFLEYLKNFQEFPLAESAQFALVAATLLLIKSKALLPGLDLTPEETEGIEDLGRRLALLKRFRELSRRLQSRRGSASLYFANVRAVTPIFAPPPGLSTSMLSLALQVVLAAIPEKETLSSVFVKKVISLEEMIENLKSRIGQTLHMSFKDFSGVHRGERVNIIVSFLALLELIRQGIVAATQKEKHGDILMETEEIATPRY